MIRQKLQDNDALSIDTGWSNAPRETHEKIPKDTYLYHSPQNDISIGTESRLYFPLSCKARKDSGEFLFVGRYRLGRRLLQCAPRRKDFEELWERAQLTLKTQCYID